MNKILIESLKKIEEITTTALYEANKLPIDTDGIIIKQKTFTQTQIEKLQSEVYKITGKGEVMQLFNKMLGVSAG